VIKEENKTRSTLQRVKVLVLFAAAVAFRVATGSRDVIAHVDYVVDVVESLKHEKNVRKLSKNNHKTCI